MSVCQRQVGQPKVYRQARHVGSRAKKPGSPELQKLDEARLFDRLPDSALFHFVDV
jgi:hypothetical protein